MKLFGVGLLSLVLVGAVHAHSIWVVPSGHDDSADVV
jgi:hypothetical protein